MKSTCRKAFVAAVLLSGFSSLLGCRPHSTEVLGRNTVSYEVKGTVLSSDVETGMITLQHDAIPGFMGAMTMPYKLEQRSVAGELHPGDLIRARILSEKDSDGVFHNTRLNEIAVLAQKHGSYTPTSNFHAPAKGDVVPEFALVDQDGRPTSLSAQKGKAVLLTFLYTRCPIGDFCPKMTRNFQEIRAMVAKDPALEGRTDFVSVSFDPAYDTSPVLQAYGKNYVGNDGFAHWQFDRTRDDVTLRRMEQFFNLGTTPENSGSITHSLSTVLIDRDGRIADWMPGNEWTPQDVFAELQALAK